VTLNFQSMYFGGSILHKFTKVEDSVIIHPFVIHSTFAA